VSGHTPGPWTIQGAYIGTDDAHVAQVKGEGRGVNSQRAEANSMLIAAAPDLLAALEELIAEMYEFHNQNTEGWNMARAAIAKATGACHED
jgi:hypothetical protein